DLARTAARAAERRVPGGTRGRGTATSVARAAPGRNGRLGLLRRGRVLGTPPGRSGPAAFGAPAVADLRADRSGAGSGARRRVGAARWAAARRNGGVPVGLPDGQHAAGLLPARVVAGRGDDARLRVGRDLP